MSDRLLTAKQLADRMGISARKLESTLKQFGIQADSRAGAVRLFNPDRITAALEGEYVAQLGAVQSARIRLFESLEAFSRLANSLGIGSGKVSAKDARELAREVKAIGSVPMGEKRTRQALVTFNAKYNAHAESAISLMNKIANSL
jgi:hypothetical protein